MKKTFIHRVAAGAALFVSLMSLGSCVNEQYEISQDRMDLNMTVFQEGLCLPLGSTEKIRLDTILNSLGLEGELGKYIANDEGAYSFFYKAEEPFDMAGQLDMLEGILDVEAIDFSKKVDFSLENIDLGNVSYEGARYEMENNLSEVFTGIDVTLPSIVEDFTIDANIRQYAQSIGDIDFEIDFGEHTGDFSYAGVPGDLVIPDELLLPGLKDVECTIDEINSKLGQSISLETSIDNVSVETHIAMPFHEYVKSVSDVHIKDGAKLKVSVTMLNTCFTSGSVTPHVDMDLHELFHLSALDGTPLANDHIVGDFTLSNENNWSASAEYKINSLIIYQKDWAHELNSEGKEVLWLKKDVKAGLSGSLNGSNLKTSMAVLDEWLDEHPTAASRNVMIKVQLAFEDLIIDDVTAELNPIPFGPNIETFDINIPEMNFPEEVKNVKEVVFSDESAIDLELSVSNLSSIGDLDFNIDDLHVTFPDRLIIDGANADNAIVIPGANLAAGAYSQRIKVKGVKIGDIDETGKVPAYKGVVSVVAGGSVGGTIHTARLPQTKEQDLGLNGHVEAKLVVQDYTLELKSYIISDQTNPEMFKKESIRIDVPKEIADIEGLAVYPKGSPEIKIDITIPELSMGIAPIGADGLKIYLPRMLALKKGNYPYEEWFDHASYAIVFPSGKAFPSQIVLPIDHIVIDAEKDETDGKYYCSGEFEIKGAVGIEDGALMTKADVDLLSKPGTKVSFVAEIPALEPDNIAMSSYTASIGEQKISFEPLKGIDLPQMLHHVDDIELDNVYLTLSIETGEGFPSLGENSELAVGLQISMPDFIVIEDQRYVDGKLSLNGSLEKVPGKSSMKLSFDPIKVSKLGLDMDYEQLKGLAGEIVVDGSVSLTGASLNVDEWVGKTNSIDLTAVLATVEEGVVTDRLGIGKITANIDYQLDPVNTMVDLTALSEFLGDEAVDVKIDIDKFFVTADLTSNIGVPVKAEMLLIPYYGNEPGTPIEQEIVIDGVASAADVKTTKLYLSNKAPENPQDYDKFIELDIISLLYKDNTRTKAIDSLKVELNAGTDPQKTCVFEPSADYVLSVDYSAGIPMALGEGFEVSYTTVMELPEEAAKIMEYGSLALCGEVETSFPIGFRVRARLLDSNNEPLNVTDGDIGMEIKSSDASGNPATSEIRLVIGNENKVDISDLKSLELVLSADAKRAPGVQLREDNFIRLSLYAMVPEGVTLDASKLVDVNKKENNE